MRLICDSFILLQVASGGCSMFQPHVGSGDGDVGDDDDDDDDDGNSHGNE